MSVPIEDRYKQMFEQLRFASEIRLKILATWGAVYAALGLIFAWVQSHAKSISWLVAILAVGATVLFWLGDCRNRPAIGAAKKVGAQIDADPNAQVPEQQRYYTRLNQGIGHGPTIDTFAVVALILLSFAAGYLFHSNGELPK